MLTLIFFERNADRLLEVCRLVVKLQDIELHLEKYLVSSEFPNSLVL